MRSNLTGHARPPKPAHRDSTRHAHPIGQAQMNVPIIGLVENMSYFISESEPEKRHYIFGKDGGKRLAEDYELPFLGQIPLVQKIREGGDIGIPVMMSDDAASKEAFAEFAGTVARSVSMRNAHMNAEEVAEVVES